MGKVRRYVATLAALIGALALAVPAAAAIAPASTGGATDITTNSAVLHGVVHPTDSQSSWYFEYGPTAALGQRTPSHPTGSGQANASQSISGLDPGTTYFYRLVVVQGTFPYSTTSRGETRTFTTMPPFGAVATTGDATSITRTSALLSGVVDTSMPGTTFFFQYGTTTAFGKRTHTKSVATGLSAVSSRIRGLRPGTRYYFRLVVYQGGSATLVAYGGSHTFRTKPPAPRVSVRSRRLTVHHRVTSIPMSCTGPHGTTCAGTVTVRAGGRGAICARARVRIAAGRRRDIRAPVTSYCAALLAKARHHRIRGQVIGRFRTAQPARLRSAVTVVRR